jgi:hypothetical protein
MDNHAQAALPPVPTEGFRTKIVLCICHFLSFPCTIPQFSRRPNVGGKNVTGMGLCHSPLALPCQIIPPMFPDPNDASITQLI